MRYKACKTCRAILIGAEERGERCNECLDKAVARQIDAASK